MKLYLSRLLLNQYSRRGMSEIMHPYEMHRTLMRAFPGTADNARQEFGVLFRAESGEYGKPLKVYVQSLVEPDWSFLEDFGDYLYPQTHGISYEYKNILEAYDNIREGNHFAFRLRANPTKRIAKKDDPLRGKRVELNREEEQIAWLIRKGKEREKGISGGFELVRKHSIACDTPGTEALHVTVHTERKVRGRKKTGPQGHHTTHLAVLFEGLLQVTDAEAFRNTLIYGIGSAKAFGFGLLSLAPTNT